MRKHFTVSSLNISHTNLFFYLQDNLKFVGHDINVTGVWERNITGKGVTVSVIDDGESLDNLRVKFN